MRPWRASHLFGTSRPLRPLNHTYNTRTGGVHVEVASGEKRERSRDAKGHARREGGEAANESENIVQMSPRRVLLTSIEALNAALEPIAELDADGERNVSEGVHPVSSPLLCPVSPPAMTSEIPPPTISPASCPTISPASRPTISPFSPTISPASPPTISPFSPTISPASRPAISPASRPTLPPLNLSNEAFVNHPLASLPSVPSAPSSSPPSELIPPKSPTSPQPLRLRLRIPATGVPWVIPEEPATQQTTHIDAPTGIQVTSSASMTSTSSTSASISASISQTSQPELQSLSSSPNITAGGAATSRGITPVEERGPRRSFRIRQGHQSPGTQSGSPRLPAQPDVDAGSGRVATDESPTISTTSAASTSCSTSTRSSRASPRALRRRPNPVEANSYRTGLAATQPLTPALSPQPALSLSMPASTVPNISALASLPPPPPTPSDPLEFLDSLSHTLGSNHGIFP